MLTADRLRELLDYNPVTGVFLWKIDRASTARVGSTAGYRRRDGYTGMKIEQRELLAHRVAWLHVHGRWPVDQLDHVNGIKSDNRLTNLREASRAENKCNTKRPATNTSGFKGVTWHIHTKRWVARLTINRRRVHLGYFSTADEAHTAYCTAAAQRYGRFFNPG